MIRYEPGYRYEPGHLVELRKELPWAYVWGWPVILPTDVLCCKGENLAHLNGVRTTPAGLAVEWIDLKDTDERVHACALIQPAFKEPNA